MADAIETKLSAARTRLILDHPFLGALVLRLPLKQADASWCRSTATDARAFYYNRDFIDKLTLGQTQFMLAHEALHCALSHFARRQHRNKRRWDIACDYAINPLLIKEGLEAPLGALRMQCFEGMTAEEIYPSIADNDNQETLDEHLYDGDDSGRPPPSPQYAQPPPSSDKSGGESRPQPLGETEKQDLKTQWQQRLAGAAQQAMQAGKLSGEMARLVDFFLQPQLPWQHLLAHYLSQTARDDYSFSRPSSRRGDPAIRAALRSAQINLVVALDTSGSIGESELRRFMGEVDALKGQIRARITLLACDAELDQAAPWIYEPWQEFTLPDNLKGGGATDFQPVFRWIELNDTPPDLLIYFTDGQGDFPASAPAYPVLWLVKGQAAMPWGRRVQLN